MSKSIFMLLIPTTTAEKVFDIVRKMPKKKQERILDSLEHDCPHSHVPNKRTIAAIKDKKTYVCKSTTVEDMINEMFNAKEA